MCGHKSMITRVRNRPRLHTHTFVYLLQQSFSFFFKTFFNENATRINAEIEFQSHYETNYCKLLLLLCYYPVSTSRHLKYFHFIIKFSRRHRVYGGENKQNGHYKRARSVRL